MLDISAFCDKNSIFYQQDVSLKKLSSFKIGGIAPYIISPNSATQVSEIINYVNEKNIKYKVIGNCSNILFPDETIDCLLIKTDKLNSLTIKNNNIICGAGLILAKVASTALKSELSGMECLFGIPGTIGGAIKMNAGAYGSEMSHIAVETEYVTADGIIKTVSGNDHNFSYRHSCFSDTDIIVQTVLKLSDGNYSDIKNKMDEYTSKRVSSQPLDMPSAGSVFKRPEGFFAGKLIEDSGLKGFSVGGAQVSEKHAGFIVNKGNASSEDVKELIRIIQSTVAEKFGVMLETEIKFF